MPVRASCGCPASPRSSPPASLLISSSDIIVIYVPLLGAERNIDVHDIGLLLTMRSAASMVARLLYSRAVIAFGRWPLMIGSTFVYAASYAAFAAPLPLWAMHLRIAMMGFSFGFAATSDHHDHGQPVQRRAGHRQLDPHHGQPRRPVRPAVQRRAWWRPPQGSPGCSWILAAGVGVRRRGDGLEAARRRSNSQPHIGIR